MSPVFQGWETKQHCNFTAVNPGFDHSGAEEPVSIQPPLCGEETSTELRTLQTGKNHQSKVTEISSIPIISALSFVKRVSTLILPFCPFLNSEGRFVLYVVEVSP